MTTTERTPRNWTYLTVCAIVRLYMLGALAISFGHILTASHLLQLDGWQRWTVPFAIDGFAVLGLIGRSQRFDKSTRRTGLALQAGAGVVSLVCNVYAGHTIGQRIYGALIVAAFVVAEMYAGKLRPAPAISTINTKRSEAAKRGVETKRRNREQALKAERAETARIRKAAREMEKQAA